MHKRVAEHLEPDTREALEAYAAGINHFLSTERQDVEAVFAELGWMPEPWTVADSIAVWMRLSERFDRSWQNEVHALRTHQARAQQSTDQRPPVIDNGAAVVEEADFASTNPEAYRRLKALAAEAIAERYPLE
ncbi:MAG: penicillin acylase family protein, partial [Firmicutes bacterium]|nr:penicillin acylase family protein [Bacillota bacterium]